MAAAISTQALIGGASLATALYYQTQVNAAAAQPMVTPGHDQLIEGGRGEGREVEHRPRELATVDPNDQTDRPYPLPLSKAVPFEQYYELNHRRISQSADEPGEGARRRPVQPIAESMHDVKFAMSVIGDYSPATVKPGRMERPTGRHVGRYQTKQAAVYRRGRFETHNAM